ncbi:ATP-binding cassette domain-containing protein [Candidatus Saccharibacteria bacterium]|nr:ATP-binding cassette domain-containing protein [Candidatus Saccharibacteria bacterium]
MSLIKVQKLSLGYGNHTVVKDLSFTVDSEDFICIVGANGSGKSTLAKGILGLLKPQSGKVIFDNLKATAIGYMPQEHKIIPNFPASVLEITLSGFLNQLHFRPYYTAKQKARAKHNLALLHIEDLANENFSDLSGGQRQKVLLARALCATTKLLILDEPSNNLDHQSKQELYELALRLNRQHHIAVLMITHDLDHHNLIGDKILALSNGQKYFFGPTAAYVKKIHSDTEHHHA